MLIIYLFYSISSFFINANHQLSNSIIGAWKDENGVMIFTEHHFSYSAFSPTEFHYTYGGFWSLDNNHLILHYEYHTESADKVGTDEKHEFRLDSKSLILGNNAFENVDNGQPGQLEGAWLFYNRIRDGEPGNPRMADNPRKTMKILSGTRFQWIAYDTETKAFSGTGGGTYTTVNGKYTENIDFFPRDNSRVGASLEFDFEIKADEWHHSGLNSRGEPLYEVWKKR